jgi:hypothetical protein
MQTTDRILELMENIAAIKMEEIDIQYRELLKGR